MSNVAHKANNRLLINLLLVLPLTWLRGQPPLLEDQAEVQSLVKQIYSDVSGNEPDRVNWERVRSYFAEDALIVLRTSRDTMTHFTVDGFIQDFKDFYGSPRVQGHGFKEEVLTVDSRIYHEIAYVAVVYSATITDGTSASQRGVDFWLLTRNDHQWKVVAVTNEVIPADREIPDWMNLSK